jgi:hypothetical protein
MPSVLKTALADNKYSSKCNKKMSATDCSVIIKSRNIIIAGKYM